MYPSKLIMGSSDPTMDQMMQLMSVAADGGVTDLGALLPKSIICQRPNCVAWFLIHLIHLLELKGTVQKWQK